MNPRTQYFKDIPVGVSFTYRGRAVIKLDDVYGAFIDDATSAGGFGPDCPVNYDYPSADPNFLTYNGQRSDPPVYTPIPCV